MKINDKIYAVQFNDNEWTIKTFIIRLMSDDLYHVTEDGNEKNGGVLQGPFPIIQDGMILTTSLEEAKAFYLKEIDNEIDKVEKRLRQLTIFRQDVEEKPIIDEIKQDELLEVQSADS